MLLTLAEHADVLLIALLGCAVGSFLNVVIYRLPIMMTRAEQAYAWSVLHEEALPEDNPYLGERFNLCSPPSRCPHCATPIRAWQNIPIFSYLWQKGRCRHCQAQLTSRYVWVEALTGLLSAVVAFHFQGQALPLAAALLFTWVLVALFFIDAEHQLLPDDLTLPLLWLGLALAVAQVFVPLQSAVLGAIAGYGLLWLVFWLFKIITGKEGMGYGDFKLLAALLAWCGIEALPTILIGATLSGVLFALWKRIGTGRAMAFGPFLALSGWLAFMTRGLGVWL